MRLLSSLLLALTALPAATVWWHDEGPLGPAFYVDAPEGRFAFAPPPDAVGDASWRGLAGEVGWVTLSGGRALGLAWEGGPRWLRLEIVQGDWRWCTAACRFGGEEGWVEAPLPRAGLLPLGLEGQSLVARGTDSLWLLPPVGSGSVRSLSEAQAGARAWLAGSGEIILAPAPAAPEGEWFPWGIRVEVLEEDTGPHTVIVLGAVLNPGPLPAGFPLTLTEAVAAAVPSQNADLSRVEIRLPDGSWSAVNLFPVLTGEMRPLALPLHVALMVPATAGAAVHVLGTVARPGPAAWAAGLTAGDALQAAGGVGEAGVILDPDGSQRSFSPGQADILLSPGDIVVAGFLPLGAGAVPWREVFLAVFTPAQVAALLGE